LEQEKEEKREKCSAEQKECFVRISRGETGGRARKKEEWGMRIEVIQNRGGIKGMRTGGKGEFIRTSTVPLRGGRTTIKGIRPELEIGGVERA